MRVAGVDVGDGPGVDGAGAEVLGDGDRVVGVGRLVDRGLVVQVGHGDGEGGRAVRVVGHAVVDEDGDDVDVVGIRVGRALVVRADLERDVDGVADDANGATTLTITVTDLNDQTPVYQAADADDAISVAENFGTGSIDAGTISSADSVDEYTCTLGGADAGDFDLSLIHI